MSGTAGEFLSQVNYNLWMRSKTCELFEETVTKLQTVFHELYLRTRSVQLSPMLPFDIVPITPCCFLHLRLPLLELFPNLNHSLKVVRPANDRYDTATAALLVN